MWLPTKDTISIGSTTHSGYMTVANNAFVHA